MLKDPEETVRATLTDLNAAIAVYSTNAGCARGLEESKIGPSRACSPKTSELPV
jgi:hypothetical protein